MARTAIVCCLLLCILEALPLLSLSTCQAFEVQMKWNVKLWSLPFAAVSSVGILAPGEHFRKDLFDTYMFTF